jgi:tetratricopeptide (TPR) repeat protein
LINRSLNSDVVAQLDESERSVKYWTSRACELLYPLQGRFAWSPFTSQLEIAMHAEYCLELCILYGVECTMSEALITSFTAYVRMCTGQKYEPKGWSKVVQQYDKMQEPAGINDGLLCYFMSLRWFLLKDYGKALAASKKALHTADQLGEQEKVFGLPYLYHLGFVHREHGNYEDALRCFQKVLDFYHEPSYTRLITLLESSHCGGDYLVESFKQASVEAKTVLGSKRDADTALPLILMGSLRMKQGWEEEGLKQCNHALEMFRETYGGTHLYAAILVEVVVRTFRDLGQHAEALDWLETVRPLVDTISQTKSIFGASTLESLAVSQCCEGNYEEAWQTLRKLREVRQRFAMASENGTPSSLGVDEEVTRVCTSLLLQERYEEARSLCECTVSQLKKEPIVPRQAFARARQQVRLANIYERQPKVDLRKSEVALTEAIEPLRNELGDANDEVKKVRDDLRRISGILETWQRPETPKVCSTDASEVEIGGPLLPESTRFSQQAGFETILMGALVIGLLLSYQWYQWV